MGTKPLRVGVAGLGMVAQLMHLPYLKEMDEFEIAAVCDISPKLADYIGGYYDAPGRYTDAGEMLKREKLDAIFILTFHHSEITKLAARAGVHVFCEKPVSFSLRECDEMIGAVERAGVTFMTGYMKRYDEGYLHGLKHFDAMRKSGDLRMIHVHDACFQNDLALRSLFQPRTFGDVPGAAMEKATALIYKRMKESLGAAPRFVLDCYRMLLETGSHDVNVLRGAFGSPEAVLHTEIWPGGNWFVSTLDYGGRVRAVLDVARAARNWGDEHITAFGMTRTASVVFPIPFHKNEPTIVRLMDMNGDAVIDQTVRASLSEAFKNELHHFWCCVKRKKAPLTSIEDARADTELMIKIIKKFKK